MCKKTFFRIWACAFFLCACLMLAADVCDASDSWEENEQFIKVGLNYGTSVPYSVIRADSGLGMAKLGTDGLTPADSPANGQTELILRKSGDSIDVEDFYGNVLDSMPGDGSFCFTSSKYFTRGEFVIYEDREYRGGITAVTNSSGGINTINVLNIEDYVKGVLNREIGHTGNIEALKAQAVTARSYAAANSGRHSSAGFNVCTGNHCQSYEGVSGEYESTNRAADETAGILMYYGGVPVAGYYFANSGGATENSEDVWGSEIGYLRGIADEFSPEYKWEASFTRSQIESSMSGYGIGEVKSVTIDEVNSSGYVASVTVTGSSGSATVEMDRIRSMFSSSLKSRNFTIDTEGGTLVPGGSGGGAYYAFDGTNKSVLGRVFSAVTSSGIEELTLDGAGVLNGEGESHYASYIGQGVSAQGASVIFNSDSDRLIIYGKGFGHGVGMSQDGALAMGDKGYSFTDILKYYYTDIEVK